MDRNDLLAAARAAFLHGFIECLDDLIRCAEVQLFDKSGNAASLVQQSRLRDARAVLLNQDIALKRQLSSIMEQLLNRSFQTAYSTFRPSFGGSLSLSSLSLVDTSALEGELQIDQMTKKLREVVEDSLRDLNIRIALLFEQEDIKERENPFRPYLFVRCIVTSLENIQVAQELIPALAHQLVDSITDKVGAIYDELNTLLANNGIAAQLQLKIKKAPQPPAAGRYARQAEPVAAFQDLADDAPSREQSRERIWTDTTRELMPANRADELLDWVQGFAPSIGAAASTAAIPGVSGGGQQSSSVSSASRAGDSRHPAMAQSTHLKRSWLTEAHAVGEVLRSFFAQPVHADSDIQSGLDVGSRPSILKDMAHSLQGVSTPEASAMFGEDGRVRNLVLEHRAVLSERAGSNEEQMVIDVVAMLFEFILRDTQVPAEVRAQLGRLQFLVLKVALQDPALFSQKSHPARMLVNRIGSIVLDLQKLDPGGERVTAEICRIVETLLGDETGEVSLFTRLLDEFDAFVAAELRAADQQIDQAVQALENAESRTLQFARITSTIAQALTQVKVDDFLHDFLINTWARVVERAGREGAHRAMRYRQLVPDIVWSVAPKVSEHDRRELFGLIPDLLATLREGIAMLEWSGQERQVVLDWLVDSHRHALRAGTLPVQPPPKSYIDEIFMPFVLWFEPEPDERAAHVAAQNRLGLDGKLLDEAIGEMNLHLHVVDRQLKPLDDLPLNDMPGDVLKEQPGPIAWDEIHDRLRSGVAIEITLDTEPVGAYLNWVGSTDSGMVLSIAGSSAPSVVSQKVFRRLVAAGRVRFLEDTALFERAVESLLVSADHLDSRASAVARA